MPSTWFTILDGLKTEIDDTLLPDLKLPDLKPPIHVVVLPAPPDLEWVGREHHRLPVIYLSCAGFVDQQEQAEFGEANVQFFADVLCRGNPKKVEDERNRVAALIAEQLHIRLKDSSFYCFNELHGRPMAIAVTNLSTNDVDKTATGWWRLAWRSRVESQELNPDTLNDFVKVVATLKTTEVVEGADPDPDEPWSTEIDPR
jgi:hypothetical protein